MHYLKLWIVLGVVVVVAFSVLGYFGLEIYRQAPPIPQRVWKTGTLRFAFWTLNSGLALMVLLSLLPIGLLQTWASVERGLWYARSAEFLQTELMNTLRWLRLIGDTIFAAGALSLGWFVLGIKTGWSLGEELPSVKNAAYIRPLQTGQ